MNREMRSLISKIETEKANAEKSFKAKDYDKATEILDNIEKLQHDFEVE